MVFTKGELSSLPAAGSDKAILHLQPDATIGFNCAAPVLYVQRHQRFQAEADSRERRVRGRLQVPSRAG
jgi:hypothetical protein